MNVKFLKHSAFSTLSIVLLLSLPACWWPFEDDKKTTTVTEQPVVQKVVEPELTGEVVVTMGGKPIVTSNSLQEEKDKLIESNPQFKAMMAFMDVKQFDRNLSDGLTNQAIVDRYVSDKGINKRAEYKKDLADGYKAVERMINTKYFSESFSVSVTDTEAKIFYDKNKDVMPELLIAQGGVQAVGIEFDTKMKANEFLKKVKTGKDLQAVAQSEGLSDQVKDFKMVTQQSLGIDPKIKERVLGFKSCPTAEVVTLDDKTHVVVQGISKKDPEYRSFDQVKDGIKTYLEKEKRAEEFDKKIELLKEEYDVQVNEDYFAGDEQATAFYDDGMQEQLTA